MSILRALERRGLERRGAPGNLAWGDSSPPSNGMLGGSVAGTQVTEKSALQVAAVYGSVSIIADAVSTLPIDLMSSEHRRTGKMLPSSPLIEQPYVEISRMDWWGQFTWSMALRGNFYGHIIERDRNLYATQIRPVHPDHVQVRRMPGGSLQYRFGGVIVPINDVFHVRYQSVAESLTGLNPIEYLRNTLGLARAADLYGAAQFQNSGWPGLVLETEEDLDPDETQDLARSWNQAHQGIGQAGIPAVLTRGLKANALTISPEDMQFLASRQYDAGVISGMIFRVPPHILGIVDRTTSWGTGIEEQTRGFVANTLLPYLGRGEEALTALHPPGQFVKFDLSERTRGDKLQRYQSYNLGRLGGWLNADEIRAEEDLPPIPDGEGQEYLVPVNSELLSQALEAYKQMQEQPNQPPATGAQNGHVAGAAGPVAQHVTGNGKV